MAPPELARDAPVLDVVEPLVVDGGPVVRVELDAAVGHDFQRDLGNALAGVQRAFGRRLAHGHEPLVGQHGLQHHAGAVALGLHHLVRLDLDQIVFGLQLRHHGLARLVALQALELLGSVFVDVGVQREDHDQRQVVPHRAGVVVEVVRAGDLDAARAEFRVDEVVGDDGDVAVAQRQFDFLADQVLVARVVGVHAQRAVGQHGFRARGGDGQAAQRDALAVLVDDGLRAVDEGVEDVPHVAVGLFGLDFQVGHGGQQLGVPVDQALAAVDQSLFVQAHEGLDHAARHALVHGEVLARPVGRGAQAADLPGDGVAGLFLPFPDLFHEFLATQVVARNLLGVELSFNHDLRGDAGVVGAGDENGVVAQHAVVADQAIHDGLVERMAHVQRARHVRRRELDDVGLAFRPGFYVLARLEIAAAFPLGVPAGFQFGGFEALGEFLGLFRDGVRGRRGVRGAA